MCFIQNNERCSGEDNTLELGVKQTNMYEGKDCVGGSEIITTKFILVRKGEESECNCITSSEEHVLHASLLPEVACVRSTMTVLY